jgi:hypothetical protein
MARRALYSNRAAPTVASLPGFAILPVAPVMKKIGLILLAGFFLCAALPQLRSQSEDPSEIFLKAYMTAQQGEKLEHENQFKAALAKYRFAGSLIEELRKSHPEWQPAIVEYRGRKVSEGIMRVQGKVSTQDDLMAGPTPLPLPEIAPAIAQTAAPTASPNVEIPKETLTEAAPQPPLPLPAQTPSDAAIKAATKKLQSKVDQLEEELKKSRSQFSAPEK